MLTESRLMTTPEDSLLLLKSLRTNPTSLLPNSTSGATANNAPTQVKREWWTPAIPGPPPIPSCWWLRGCEWDLKREWTPPPIPSSWWSGNCKHRVDLE